MADRRRSDRPSEARIAALTYVHQKLNTEFSDYPVDRVAELMTASFEAGIEFAAQKVGDELARPSGCEFEISDNGKAVSCGAPPKWSTDCGGGQTLLCDRHKQICEIAKENDGVEFHPLTKRGV